jgi:POT family proton-dependent oligopeptide transporter
MATSKPVHVQAKGDWFGQPRGLTILFLTETWDQFSFFGMRALLVLYMTKHLMIAQQKASWIYGLYAALVYLTPIFGGIITDRWLGRRSSVIIGGLIMAIGHFMMASEALFLFALATIAIGNGLFLPSLPSQIDSLYEKDDPRRKSAYSVYYFGVNLGAFAAPVVIGTVGEIYGFHYGFALAGIGMIVALATYIMGRKYLPAEPLRERGKRTVDTERTDTGRSSSTDLFRRIGFLVLIAAIIVVFRGAYEQLGNTISLWADQSVDRTVSTGLSIPVTWFQSLNPMMVFILTPLFIANWTRMAKTGREPSSGVKMLTGAAVIGLAYLLIAGGAYWVESHGGKLGWPWMAAFIIVMTAGELYILPIGIGLFSRLAPKGLTATCIALWFSAGFLGNILAGWLGTFWTPLSHSAFFALIGAVALLAAGLLAFLARTIARTERTV